MCVTWYLSVVLNGIYYARVVVTPTVVATTRAWLSSRGVDRFVHCLQMVTLRQWQPLVNFLLYWRDAALTALDHFERAQKHTLGLHTFSRLATVADPA